MKRDHFTAVYVVPDLGTTPASVNRRTGELYINESMWVHLKPEHRLFILLHEMGHLIQDTSNEKLADQWAFDQYVRRGYSVKESVKALSRVLSGRTHEHTERVYEQLMRAADFDFHQNGNTQVYADMSNYLGPHVGDQGARLLAFAGEVDQLDEWEFASGKKESRREFKRRMKEKKIDGRIERRGRKSESKAYKRETQADANYVLADKWGRNARAENMGAALGGIADIAGQVGNAIGVGKFGLGGGGEAPQSAPQPYQDQQPAPAAGKQQNMLIIGGIAAVVLVVVILVLKR